MQKFKNIRKHILISEYIEISENNKLEVCSESFFKRNDLQ